MGLGSLHWNVCLDRLEFVLMYPRFAIQPQCYSAWRDSFRMLMIVVEDRQDQTAHESDM
jgi:hypothetical protein